MFFLSMGCTAELSDLIAQARKENGLKAEIVAVCSEAIADPKIARAALGAVPSDRFHLLADEQHGAFAKFGCWKNDGPQHGLFVINRAGIVRAGYVGASPFADTPEVIRRVRSLDRNVAR